MVLESWSFSDGWIALGISLFAVSFLVGALFQSRAALAAGRAAAAGDIEAARRFLIRWSWGVRPSERKSSPNRQEVDGHGPRLHRHPYDETWVVVEGNLTFRAGDELLPAATGEVVIVPPGVPHELAPGPGRRDAPRAGRGPSVVLLHGIRRRMCRRLRISPQTAGWEQKKNG